MNDNQIIAAAEKHAALYDGDDRPYIKTDVLNSFYAGFEFAIKSQAPQLAPPEQALQLAKEARKSELQTGPSISMELLIWNKAVAACVAAIDAAGVQRETQPEAQADERELPPLPEPAIKSFQVDSVMRRYDLHTFAAGQMREYASQHGQKEYERGFIHGAEKTEVFRQRAFKAEAALLSQQQCARPLRPAQPEFVEIEWDRSGRAFWHTNCTNHLGGAMKEVKRDIDNSIFKCLHCGKHGQYPVGAVGTVRSPEITAIAAPTQPVEPAEAAKWISTKDRLPEQKGFYWVYQPKCPPQSYPMQVVKFDDGHWFSSWEVTYWMLLPPIPAQTENKP